VTEEFEDMLASFANERIARREAYDYKAAQKAATGTVKQLDDNLCIYKCVACGHEHHLLEFIEETKGVCRAGRDRINDGCKSRKFMQGNYDLSPGGVYHLIAVPIGQSWERARALYWGDSNPPAK
jgi:hypothetical protein